MPIPSWQLGWKVAVGYTIVALAVAAAGWEAVNQLRAARAAGDRARKTVGVLRQIGDVQIALLRAETGQRGFLLTGEEAYLDSYERALRSVDPALGGLAQLIADSPAQQARVRLVQELAAAKMAELAQTIALRHSVGLEAALQVVNTHVGRGLMGRISSVLGEVEREERALLNRQLSERRASFWWAGRVALASSVVALFMVALSTLAANAEARRRAAVQRTLRESEERLRVTLRSIGDAVIATDTAGRVVFMNEAAQALTGWDEDAARARPLEGVFRIVNEQTRATVDNPVTKVLRAGTVVGLGNHTVLLARDGREIPIDDSGAPIRDAGGAIMGVALVFRDISERQRQQCQHEALQRETAARATAERDSRTKDEFLAILSHELRSPLQGILGWVTVLRELHANPEQQQRALQAIERGVRQQAQLVNDILDVSRIVAGKLQLERQPVDLTAVVDECVDEALPQARDKGVEMSSEGIDCSVVLGDRLRLRQLLTNLLANAIKFTPSGGRIDVRCQRDGGDSVVTVRDSGQGIAPEFLPHIFDRFTQADDGPRPSTGGLGLGLSIVRQIADVHGGSVRAESAGLGHGAVFTLHLPLAPEVQRGAEELRAAAQPGVRSSLDELSILIVDDDVETRESLATLLQSRGAAVRHVGSASDALEECRQNAPNVIISDISMPEQDGYALIGMLRGEADVQQPIALALTGFAGDDDRARARAAGFDGHVPKPVDLDQLVGTILDLVAGR